MKTKLALYGLSLIGLLALPACTTTGQPDTARIARVANQAANIGTAEVLASHPEWRPQFQLAADNLHLLATSTNISLENILLVAQQLPVKELHSQEARLSFEGATLLISAIDVPELPADRLAELQPIARAIADGITTGIANAPVPPPKPPKPPTTLPPVPTVPPSTAIPIISPITATLLLPAGN